MRRDVYMMRKARIRSGASKRVGSSRSSGSVAALVSIISLNQFSNGAAARASKAPHASQLLACQNRKFGGTMTALAIAIVLAATPLAAQWLHQPTPGIPRTADGKPNLTAPAPGLLAANRISQV